MEGLVPAPTLGGELQSSSSNSNSENGLANSEVFINKIQNSMTVMEEKNLTNDSRYHGLNELKNRLQSLLSFNLFLENNFQVNNHLSQQILNNQHLQLVQRQLMQN